MGHITGLQRRVFPHSHPSQVSQVHEVLSEQANLSVHCPSFWFGHSPIGVQKGGQGSEAHGIGQGYKNPPVPRRLVAQSPFPGNVPTTHPDPLGPLPRTGLGSEHEEIRANSSTGQQVFNFVGYWFDLLTGRVLPTRERWANLCQKLLYLKAQSTFTVGQFMSLIGLLTATEKQVWSGHLHMRPIQWHLKRHWHVPEILEKIIPLPTSLHPHLDGWLDERNVFRGQPLHYLSH